MPAYPVKLQFVSLRVKTMPLEEFLLQAFDIGVHNFYESAAFCTDEMVMMLMTIEMFVAGGAIVKFQFAAEAGGGKHFHGSVHGGNPHRRATAAGQPIKFLRPQVPVN